MAKSRSLFRKKTRRPRTRRHPKDQEQWDFRPSIDPKLRRIFDKIGIPKRTPFRPDPFQTEALQVLEESDCIVSAPTGAGKTWIAVEAISKALERGQRSWYASPLKALSNAKYDELARAFGYEQLGILTGDRKENTDAPVIVGTTEILRNQLYNAMDRGIDISIHLVVLDEAHYIGDSDRGVVWEEVLIYLPARVRLLLLSATIQNGNEIASWLESVRNQPGRVVESRVRPVPLVPIFFFPNGRLSQLADQKGRLSSSIHKYLSEAKRQRTRPADYSQIIEHLRHWNLLPAIFFLKSRAECDSALLLFRTRPKKIDEVFRRDLECILDLFPFLRDHRQLPVLKSYGIASHHGGQLPQWKLLVERMMDAGHINTIFSTSTIAAGMNFPARTVVLVQSDRYNGHEFIDLTATELHQMTGRAGRRGKDKVGFALVIPGLYQNPKLISDLLDSPPESIQSQIRITFSMVLNLLLSHSMEDIRHLLQLSLGAFQEKEAHPELESRWQAIRQEIEALFPDRRCDTHDPESILEIIQHHQRLKKELSILRKEAKGATFEENLLSNLEPGRIFIHRNRALYVAFQLLHHEGKPYCLAQKVTGKVKTRQKKIHLKRVPFESIREVVDYRIEISEELSSDQLRALLETIPLEGLRPIEGKKNAKTSPEIEIIEEALRSLPCVECSSHKKCRGLIAFLQKVSREIAQVKQRLWRDFCRHIEFLKLTGFVDSENHLTADGIWASQLRMDEPLLIAEAIRKGAFDDADPAMMAALIAPFVSDKGREVYVDNEKIEGMSMLEADYERVMEMINGLARLKRSWGFDTPVVQHWPAAAIYFWARSCSWNDLLRSVKLEEGDMVSLILRTADHLRQVCSLEKTHPGIAQKARRAIDLIQREPAFVA